MCGLRVTIGAFFSVSIALSSGWRRSLMRASRWPGSSMDIARIASRR
jgi:hypothetical protein